MVTLTITRGSITVHRDTMGNATIHPLGGNPTIIQRADVTDLIAALAEFLRVSQEGTASRASMKTGELPPLKR